MSQLAQISIVEVAQFCIVGNINELDPDKYYFYRFKYNDVYSRTGRCRTLPKANADLKKLRLAIVTCNDHSSGYFNVFYKLAIADVDFVIHLGDFVYEYSQYPDGYGERYRDEISLEDEKFKIPKDSNDYEGCYRASCLKDYRKIYRTYREDRALQAAMESHTWMIMLDDHEIADDFYWDYERDTAGAHPDHSIYKKLGKESEAANKAMRTLCQEAKQAWREYVPYRPIIDNAALDLDIDYPNYKLCNQFRLYRNFRFGNLVEFFLSDSRSYRDKPEWDINDDIEEVLHDAMEDDPNAPFTEILETERMSRNLKNWQLSMLGPVQKKWLIDGVTQSEAKWKVWGNQTLLATALINEQANKIDDWHGFKAERYEILHAIKESETKTNNTEEASYFVVFTGDMHTSLIAYLKTDFEGTKNKFNEDYMY